MQRTRRDLLAASGSALVGGLAGCLGGSSDPTPNSAWEPVDSPVQGTLFDAVTTRAGPFAVGEGGYLLKRGDGDWSPVLEHGPQGQDTALVGAAVTDNGGALWFCGGGGVVARYDVHEGQLTDYSYPEGHTSSWADVATVGLAGTEWVFLTNSSGELLYGQNDHGSMNWEEQVQKPGGGASSAGIEFDTHGFLYLCNTNSEVLESVDGGHSWRQIGIPGSSVGLHDIAPFDATTIDIAGGDGHLYRFDGFEWTDLHLDAKTFNAVERSRQNGLVVGESGHIYRFGADGWTADPTATGVHLHGAILASPGNPAIAVGGGGTILERTG